MKKHVESIFFFLEGEEKKKRKTWNQSSHVSLPGLYLKKEVVIMYLYFVAQN